MAAPDALLQQVSSRLGEARVGILGSTTDHDFEGTGALSACL